MGCFFSSEEDNLQIEKQSSIKVDTQRTTQAQIIGQMKKEEKKVSLNPLERYHISPKVLGAGGFGKVFLAKLVDDPESKFAIKALNKRHNKMKFADVKKEIEFLQKLDHKHIIKYFEAFQDRKYVYIVTEYCPNGDLFDYIKNEVSENGSFKENEACKIMRTLLKTVNYLHSMNIAHLDIKPENIMLGEDKNLKLIDFGISKQMENEKFSGIVGSSFYIAPEVIAGKYDLKCDIWSCGVILYILLCGYLPFNGQNTNAVLKKIKLCDLNFTHKEFSSISENGMELVKMMLDPDPKTRCSAAECLEHPWFTDRNSIKNIQENEEIDLKIVQNIKDFNTGSIIKKKAINVLVKFMTSREISDLNTLFERIDTDHTGFIKIEELAKALKKVDREISQDEIDGIFKGIDIQGNQKINYSEFIAATLNVKETLTEAKLLTLFKNFDLDNSGYITLENLQGAFQKFGNNISKSELSRVFDQHDVAKDGKLSYKEFERMMLDKDDDSSEGA
ncbi:unnamed protein product [Moneuplotes crassus]|uniref:Uncharacterized protein n=1 Tax=Euplotes crassus TaxID=5936 RepID=A0AAD1UCQ7_EUPCR|nr:unnamed protein product [Moneuplotes crassus]